MSIIQIVSIDPAIQQVFETFTGMQAWPHWREIAGGAAKEYGVSQVEFEQVLPEYQRFMALSVAFPGLGMLGPRIDILWHSHILNTIRYASFCTEYMGRFVHHLPCSSYEIYGVPGEAQAGICNEPPATCMDPWPAPPDPPLYPTRPLIPNLIRNMNTCRKRSLMERLALLRRIPTALDTHRLLRSGPVQCLSKHLLSNAFIHQETPLKKTLSRGVSLTVYT